jgi:tryptophan-rich sensory protein
MASVLVWEIAASESEKVRSLRSFLINMLLGLTYTFITGRKSSELPDTKQKP